MIAVRGVLATSVLTATVLALAGCAPAPSAPAPTGDTGSRTSAPATEGGDAPSAPGGGSGDSVCPTVPQEGFDLHSSPLVTRAPGDGQILGGTDHPVSWTFAEPQEYAPDVDLYYVNTDGDAISMGGVMLEDLGGNEWGTSKDVFWSDAADRPGFAILGVTHNATDHDVIGVYCLTFKVTE